MINERRKSWIIFENRSKSLLGLVSIPLKGNPLKVGCCDLLLSRLMRKMIVVKTRKPARMLGWAVVP